jgi:hypothetical protein
MRLEIAAENGNATLQNGKSCIRAALKVESPCFVSSVVSSETDRFVSNASQEGSGLWNDLNLSSRSFKDVQAPVDS